MEFMGLAGVAAITAICYLIGMIASALPIDNKWIPVICGVSGLALGIAGMFLMPDFPGTDYITAAAIGVVSGLAATGADQVYKQMNK